MEIVDYTINSRKAENPNYVKHSCIAGKYTANDECVFFLIYKLFC